MPPATAKVGGVPPVRSQDPGPSAALTQTRACYGSLYCLYNRATLRTQLGEAE